MMACVTIDACNETSDKQKDNESANRKNIHSNRSKNNHPMADLQETFGNQTLQGLIRNNKIQTKLNIGEPGDIYELEADRLADNVLRMTQPKPHLGYTCGDSCMKSRKQPISQQHEGLQLKQFAIKNAEENKARLTVFSALRSPGQPLGQATRNFFESGFGYDFSDVRIHNDEPGSTAAQAIGAKAFTRGKDIVFNVGQYIPESNEGKKLLAHELTHVLQQSLGSSIDYIQRQPVDAASTSNQPSKQPQPEDVPRRPPSDYFFFRGVMVTADAETMRLELRNLIGRVGLLGADIWIRLFIESGGRPGAGMPLPFSAHAGAYGGQRARTPLDAVRDMQEEERRQQVAPAAGPIVPGIYASVRKEATDFLELFESQLRQEALNILELNEITAKAEKIKYGITEIEIPPLGGFPVPAYSMDTGSSGSQGLSASAKLLLARRKEIENLRDEKSKHLVLRRDPYDPMGRVLMPDDQYEVIGKEIEEKLNAYNIILNERSSEYPILASLADPDKSIGYLEQLANAGPNAANIIGLEIDEKLLNINKTKEELKPGGGANVWRLPKVVGIVRMKKEIASDYMKHRLVDYKVEDEQPGPWQSIALATINIVAIALAPATGGLSLAAVAPLNLAATAQHVQEYLLQEAMSKSAFDKAHALSQEEPSLFWLALDIVGNFGDVTALLGAFGRLAPLVKSAQAAKGGKEAAIAVDAVRVAAKEIHGTSFAESIVSKLKMSAIEEKTTLEVAGATGKEIEDLLKATTKVEAEAAEILGETAKTTAGNVHVNKTGHIISCSSPCKDFAEKFAVPLAKDAELGTEFSNLQKKAVKSSLEKNANEATQVASESVNLEKRILEKNPDLFAKVVEDPAVIEATKLAEAESSVTKRYPKDVSYLKKNQTIILTPPEGIKVDDEIWVDYVNYFKKRLENLENTKTFAETRPPIPWNEYQKMRNMYQQGMGFQTEVFEYLKEEAGNPATSELFKNMQNPIVEENVAIAGKAEGDTTKFADQIVIDQATLQSGKPNIITFSNKSRDFNALTEGEIRSIVVADAKEAVQKYGGKITLRTRQKALKDLKLYDQQYDVSKVMLVYDFKGSKDAQRIIRSAAVGTGVEILFR